MAEAEQERTRRSRLQDAVTGPSVISFYAPGATTVAAAGRLRTIAENIVGEMLRLGWRAGDIRELGLLAIPAVVDSILVTEISDEDEIEEKPVNSQLILSFWD